jgi:O-succinylhomoserine sulfhydrylase
MKAHCDNALIIATWLDEHPKVSKVNYPGLSSHPQYELIKKQQSGFGGVLSFEVIGGREAGWTLIDQTKMLSITANLGDTKTTITHPATTTHGRIDPEQRERTGITDGLIRLSIGLENSDDIKDDLERGLSII